jgi:hypothetical protein
MSHQAAYADFSRTGQSAFLFHAIRRMTGKSVRRQIFTGNELKEECRDTARCEAKKLAPRWAIRFLPAIVAVLNMRSTTEDPCGTGSRTFRFRY